MLRILLSDHHQIWLEHTLGIKEGCPEARDIPRHGSGDPLMDRFGHMIEFLDLHD